MHFKSCFRASIAAATEADEIELIGRECRPREAGFDRERRNRAYVSSGSSVLRLRRKDVAIAGNAGCGIVHSE